jgi:integrase
MANVKFYLDSKQDKFGKYAVMLYIRGIPRGSKRAIVISTRQTIAATLWDKKKQRAKPQMAGSVELNNLLDKYSQEVTAHAQVLLTNIRRGDIAEEIFDRARLSLRSLFEPEKQSDFLTVYDMFLEQKKSEWQPNTWKKFKTLRNYLADFTATEGFSLRFDTIDLKFQDQFRQHLLEKVGLLNNTINKLFKMMKLFMKWAADREYHTSTKYEKFKMVKADDIEVVALDEAELLTLWEYDFSDTPSLERVRDCFLFQTATGQRFSDICTFRHEQIQGGYWILKTKKTGDELRIPMNSLSSAIAEKYRPLGKLPTVSNVNSNIYIKRCCRECSIDTPTTTTRSRGSEKIITTVPKWKLVSTHTARRTFVSLSIARGMGAETVMKVTGHKTNAMMKKYLDIADETVKAGMDAVWTNEPLPAPKAKRKKRA